MLCYGWILSKRKDTYTNSYELEVRESSDGVVRAIAGRACGFCWLKRIPGRVTLSWHRRLVHWNCTIIHTVCTLSGALQIWALLSSYCHQLIVMKTHWNTALWFSRNHTFKKYLILNTYCMLNWFEDKILRCAWNWQTLGTSIILIMKNV